MLCSDVLGDDLKFKFSSEGSYAENYVQMIEMSKNNNSGTKKRVPNEDTKSTKQAATQARIRQYLRLTQLSQKWEKCFPYDVGLS